jgi:hypothetical protein
MTRRKTYHSATLSTTNPTSTDLGADPGVSGDVCWFRGASASKAICAYLQLEGNIIPECMHYFRAKCIKYDS